MQKLISGIHKFQDDVFAARRDFFKKLVDGQRPQAVFVGCSDSRMVPDLICQADPGELFVVRNAGNIVAPYNPAAPSAEAATIEYALKGLGIPNVIVCGHTRCGAMQAALHPDGTAAMPAVRQWLGHAAAAAEVVGACYAHLEDDARWGVMVQENVLTQLEHLRTHPAVAAALAAGAVKLHGWVYKMETGQVFAYDPQAGQFLPLLRDGGEAVVPLPAYRGPDAPRTRQLAGLAG
ncbi:MAG: carbonic anhydrase [Gemmataceae bacterium]|nr:carbonic anhydrase [Gemmataceae bacterium]